MIRKKYGISIKISPENHQRLKDYCKRNGLVMGAVLDKSVELYLKGRCPNTRRRNFTTSNSRRSSSTNTM
jgi:hypothetical protein